MAQLHFVITVGPEPRHLYEAELSIECIRGFVSEDAPITLVTERALDQGVLDWMKRRNVGIEPAAPPPNSTSLALGPGELILEAPEPPGSPLVFRLTKPLKYYRTDRFLSYVREGDTDLPGGIQLSGQPGRMLFESKVRMRRVASMLDDFEPEAFWEMRHDPVTRILPQQPLKHFLPAEAKAHAVQSIRKQVRIQSMLALGCGTAPVAIQDAPPSYLGIDISATAVRLAQAQYPKAKFEVARAQEYSGPQRDLVVCFDVLQEIGDPEVYEAIIKRAIELASKGLLISGYNEPPYVLPAEGRYYEPVSISVQRLIPNGELQIEQLPHQLAIVKWVRPSRKWFFQRTKRPDAQPVRLPPSYPLRALAGTGPKLLVYGVSRTGSTALHRILVKHPDIRPALEPFWPGEMSPEGGPKNPPEFAEKVLLHPENFENIVRELWTRYNCVKHIVNYQRWPFYHSYPFNKMILLREGQAILLLTRKNMLRRTISEFLAAQTGDWTEGRGETQEFKPLPVDFVADIMHISIEAQKSYRKWLMDAGLAFREATYESLFGSDVTVELCTARVREILDYAGFDASKLTVDAVREARGTASRGVRTADTYRKIPNHEDIQRELGNDETGWLF